MVVLPVPSALGSTSVCSLSLIWMMSPCSGHGFSAGHTDRKRSWDSWKCFILKENVEVNVYLWIQPWNPKWELFLVWWPCWLSWTSPGRRTSGLSEEQKHKNFSFCAAIFFNRSTWPVGPDLRWARGSFSAGAEAPWELASASGSAVCSGAVWGSPAGWQLLLLGARCWRGWRPACWGTRG